MNFAERFNKYTDTILKHTESLFPLESRKKRVVVTNMRLEDTDLARAGNWPEFQKAKEQEHSFLGRVVGDVAVHDKETGKVEHHKDFTLNIFPHVTALGSYIVNGKELQVVNQLRRLPGAYPVVSADNNTVTKITAAGLNHDAILDRETGQLLLKVRSSHLKLVPLLQEMGIDREELEKHLGKELVANNQPKDKARSELLKFHQLNRRIAPPSEPIALRHSVIDFLASKKINPDVTQDTIGHRHESVSPKLYMDAAKAAIDVANGRRQPADMESLVYKSVHSIEDFVDESLSAAYPIMKKRLAYLIDRKGDFKSVVHPGVLSKPIINKFVSSEFTRYSDQSNPLDIIGTMQTVTSMGEGGIQSEHAITDAIRNVHNSHYGFLDPVHTPEGGAIGVVGHLALGVRKDGNKLVRAVYDTHTKKIVEASPIDISRGGIAFADQYQAAKDGTYEPRGAKVIAITPKGTIEHVDPKDIRYLLPEATGAFSAITNVIPFLNANSANRMLMADRHMEQAVPLADREAPLVQAQVGNKGYATILGNMLTSQAEKAGHVRSVKKDHIQLVYDDDPKTTHKVYFSESYPLNAGTVLKMEPKVKSGQRVKAGTQLLDSNFTKDGTLAIGRSLVTAFMPWRGYSYEDGIVISEEAAKKLASQHIEEVRTDHDHGVLIDHDKLFAYFPGERSKSLTGNLMPKVGDTVKPGQLLIPVLRKSDIRPETDYGKVHKALRAPYVNASQYWEGLTDGVIKKVIKTPQVTKLYIETKEPLVIGDKLSTMAGSKGIVSAIIANDQMPRTKDGHLIDVLFNPTGIVGRVNPTILFENAASKIARKTGKPYLYRAFDTRESVAEKIIEDLKEHGLSDTETLVDPTHRKEHPNVMVGENYWLKLRHQVKKKWAARSHEGPYSIDERPVRGGHESAQGIGPLDLYALLSNGFTHFLADAGGIKSSKNTDYWSAFQMGLPPPTPKRPFILDKFETYLQGAGIQIQRQGDTIKASPFTDEEIKNRSRGRIFEPQIFRIGKQGLRPERGGLFDPEVTGGHNSDRWNHLELTERVLNPLYEQPVKALTGMDTKQLDAYLAGKDFVDGKTGGEAIAEILSKIDVKKELDTTTADLRKAKANQRDPMLRKLRYLSALDKLGMTPVDAYTNKLLPVIPTKYRPIYDMPDGSLNVSDVNHGYREVLFINNELERLKKAGVDDKNLAPLRMGLYQAFSGLVGLTEPVTRGGHFRGFISQIAGERNKEGLYQARVVMRRQDLSGRSTIINAPHLGMDEVGVPERIGREIYKPYLVRNLVTLAGLNPLEARKEVEAGTDRVHHLLDDEMKRRPLLINRAPALHKFSEVALIPHRVKGEALQLNPLVFSGLNADIDGDTVGIHVPHSELAKEELLRNIPSRNILSPKSGDVMHTVGKEATLGLYLMTKPDTTRKEATVETEAEAIKLFKDNQIDIRSPINMKGKTWTVGHFLLNQILPPQYQFTTPSVVTGSTYKKLVNELVASHPEQAGRVISRLKDHGFDAVTRSGFSVNLKSLVENNKERDVIGKEVEEIMKDDPVAAIKHAEKRLEKMMDDNVSSTNPFALMTYKSGASNKHRINVRQLILAPGGVTDLRGRIVPVPLMRSYADGMTMPQYWATMPGARKGLADRAVSTQDTGAFNKELVNTTIGMRITSPDCLTKRGIFLSPEHPDVPGRWIANGEHAGELITPQLAAQLRKEGKPVLVRSPLTCQLSDGGICQKCAGKNEANRDHPIGFHVGAYAGTTITEPITQMVLRCVDETATARVTRKEPRLGSKMTFFGTDSPISMTLKTIHADLSNYGVEGAMIHDGVKWVRITSANRHYPDAPMARMTLEDGSELVAQINHPQWVVDRRYECWVDSQPHVFFKVGRPIEIVDFCHAADRFVLTGDQRVVKVLRVEVLKDYAGQVVDLQTETGAFTVNNIVTHNSFHSQGAVGAKEVGYKRIRQIFTMPENIRGKAVLSKETGAVTQVVDTDRGGWEVIINGVKHFVPHELDLAVSVNDHVKQGTQISKHGVLKIQEVSDLRGHEAARDQVINDLDAEMRSAGQNIRRRIYELAVKSMIDKSEVLDAGDAASQGVTAGDIMNVNYIEMVNRNLKHPIVHKPIVMSIKDVPFAGEDFLGPLMYQRLPRTLKEAPATAAEAKVRGGHPVVEFAYGNIAKPVKPST